MKKLTGVLVLSSSLLLLTGCRSASGTRGQEDASTPASAGRSPAPGGAIDAARGSLHGEQAPPQAGKPAPGVNLGGMKPGADSSASGSSGQGASAASLSPEARVAVEGCVDQWLEAKGLDRYGHPEGTMYAGGSPIFDETTGESRDRLEYIFQRQPEAQKACLSLKAGSQKQ